MFSLLSQARTVAVKAAVTTTSCRQVSVSSVDLGHGIFKPTNEGLRHGPPTKRVRPVKLPILGSRFRKLWRTEKKPSKLEMSKPLKQKGLMFPDSTFVTRGERLVFQFGFVYMPGLNVLMKPSFTLVAMEHGRVFVTTEKVDPNWDHVFMEHFFSEYKDTDVPIYKTYVHVVPAPMPQKFNLVEQF